MSPPAAPELPALPLAGLASYKLASVDEFSATFFIPRLWQSFLGSFGLRSTRSLEIEAEGVEVADLPLDQVLRALRQACQDPHSILGASDLGMIQEGYDILNAYNSELEDRLKTKLNPVKPQIYLIRRVYYLRGIRYIWNDSRTTAALLQATENSGSQATTPPTINTVTVANSTPAANASGATPINSQVQAQLDAFKAEVYANAKALASGTNAQIALTYARATARGVELVSAFDRPLAFGYEPMAWNVGLGLIRGGEPDPQTGQPATEEKIEVITGLRKLCNDPGVRL